MTYLLAAMDRIAFTIGGIEVAWYGLIIVMGMILALLYLMWHAKHVNLERDDAVELFLWIIPLAVVFARILYVAVRPDEYFAAADWKADSTKAFVNAIAIWDGGITIIGGILGGLIGISIFAYRMRKKANFGQIVDLVVVPLLIGQILGRLGNFVNQEAFGIPITNPKLQTFPFAVYIDNPSGVSPEFHDIVYDNVPGWFAATFFYEMVWNTIGAVFCYFVWKRNKKYPGILGIFYFFWYFLGRCWLETIRIDSVPVTLVACAIMFPLALVLGIAYILGTENKRAFKKVDEANRAGTLSSTELSSFEVSNYRFAVKWLAKSSVVAWKFYGIERVDAVDLEDGTYIKKVKKSKIADKPAQ